HPTGVATLLGGIEVNEAVGAFTTTTPRSRFMVVASPEEALTAYDASTRIYFRSAVRTGLTVIPLSNATGERVAAVAVPATPVVVPETNSPAVVVAATADYTVPKTGITTFKRVYE